MPVQVTQTGDTLHATYRISKAWPLVLSLIGLTALWLFSSWYSVECVRTPEGRVDATIRAHRLGWTTSPNTVVDLRSARIDSDSTRGGSSNRAVPSRISSGNTVHRVLLMDGSGTPHPVSSYRSSGQRKCVVLADAINRFLADPKSSRTVARQPWDPGVLFCLIFPFIGFYAYFAGRGDCTINGMDGTVRVVRWGFPSSKTTVVALGDVREFTLLRQTTETRNEPKVYPALVRTDSSVIPLGRPVSPEDDDTANLVNVLERFRTNVSTRASARFNRPGAI